MYNIQQLNSSHNQDVNVYHSAGASSSASISVSAARDGGSPIKTHSVASGRICITTFSPDVGAMPNTKAERLSQFKAVIRIANQSEIVMGPEYFFNKRSARGLSPCTLHERDDIVESLVEESSRTLNRHKTIVIGMVWQDPRSGKLHNTVDIFRGGEHILAHNKKSTNKYDAVLFPARHGWYEGSRDHAELMINGKKIWLTTGADNAECAHNNKDISESDKPDLVLIPASGISVLNVCIAKGGASTVVCNGDGHSKEEKTPTTSTKFLGAGMDPVDNKIGNNCRTPASYRLQPIYFRYSGASNTQDHG